MNCFTSAKRDAMGEYITTDGIEPLTMLAYPTPGPADYCPNAASNLPTAPQYSIVGKPKYVQGNFIYSLR